jgi:hypothetical protein
MTDKAKAIGPEWIVARDHHCAFLHKISHAHDRVTCEWRSDPRAAAVFMDRAEARTFAKLAGGLTTARFK